MSRGRYKGLKLEFYADECAQPLPAPQYPNRKTEPRMSPKKQDAMVNRFHLLNMDGTENGSASEDDSEVLPSYPTPAKWAMPAVVA